MEGNLRFKIDSASLIVGSKFVTFLLCFTLYLRAIFQVQAPPPPPPGGEGLYLEGDLTEGFFALPVWGGGGGGGGGLIFGGAYKWKGLFSEFYGMRGRGRDPVCSSRDLGKRVSPPSRINKKFTNRCVLS